MKRDALVFRLFEEIPGCFFRLIGRPDRDARHFDLKAIEYKETAVRLDGVFQPLRPEVDPAYIWEAQFYASDRVYANLWSKIGRFLDHGNPHQDWVAVVIYPSRALEQENLQPYRCLIGSDQLIRIYLDDLEPAPLNPFEKGILELITAKPEAALAKVRTLVPQIHASKDTRQTRQTLLQLIEIAILYQFPQWSREEFEKMLPLTDLRHTRVYQEALEEGVEIGVGKGVEKALEDVARRLLKQKKPLAEIAETTGLTVAHIRKLQKKRTRD